MSTTNTPRERETPYEHEQTCAGQTGVSRAHCAVSTGSVADKMSPEQIANFRNVLLGMIGPYAMMAPDEDIQFMRDQMNARFNRPQNNQGLPRSDSDVGSSA